MKIVNIVCSGTLNQQINLNSLLSLDPSIFQYDPEMYHGAYLTLNSGKITLYNSGKYIFVGLKKLSKIDILFNHMKKILSPFLHTELFGFPIIQNIVLTDSLSKSIDLAGLVKYNSKTKSLLNPEKFAGLVYRTKKGTGLIFSNGKIVIMGIKTIEEAEIIRKDILKMLI
jgi:transcription initiation factor TFIID TATA-box-binding protein